MTGAPGIARAVRRRKFSEAYRHTHVYAWRRLFKAVRNLGRELLASLRRPKMPAAFPYPCFLCGYQMTSAEDRTEWHGIGNCVDICETCCATGLDESQPDPEAANLPCPACKGRGWFPMKPIEPRPVLSFPPRPIFPTKDARFED